MAKAHIPWKFWIGDTWGLLETLCDDYDQPLDITDATDIEWCLSDEAGLVNIATLNFANGGTYVIDGPTGLCYIHYTYAQSKLLAPGYYRDQTRLFIGSEPQVQIYGVIKAMAPLTSVSLRSGHSEMVGSGTLKGGATKVP
jgi:hypothetical protein